MLKKIIKAFDWHTFTVVAILATMISYGIYADIRTTRLAVAKFAEFERALNGSHATSTETELRLKAQIIVYDIKPEVAREVAEQIYRYSHLYGRDPDLVLALARVESNLNPKARSYKDAVGLIQVRESWAGLMKEPCDLYQMDCNLRQGLKILGIYEDLFGSLELALTAYNRGENVMHSDILAKKNPRNGYAVKIMAMYERIKGL